MLSTSLSPAAASLASLGSKSNCSEYSEKDTRLREVPR